MLLSTGERMSCALCAMAINDLGHKAISLTGSQAGHRHRHLPHQGAHPRRPRRPHPRGARRRADRARRRLPGRLHRQGRHHARPRRLGHHRGRARRRDGRRGVRDLHRRRRRLQRRPADRPRRPQAPASSRFEEMLEMAASGARVLQLRSVEYARNHGVRIHCRSSFSEDPGTFVVGEEETMERPLITAVTHSTDEARITLARRPGQPGRRGPHLHRARRRERQRRHDHPERAGVRGRAAPTCASRSRAPTSRPPARRSTRSSPTSASSGSPRTRRWGRCPSSARE